MTVRIDGKTEKQAINQLKRIVDETYAQMDVRGLPYCATIADSMFAAGRKVLTEKYMEARHDSQVA